MTTTYGGIKITYDERSNKWMFELRGRERSAESLAKAKEAIDKPEPKDKKPFTKFEAWFLRMYGCEAKRVTVTSVADSTWRDGVHLWVVDGKGRSKESASDLYPCSPWNDQIIAEMQAIRAQIDDLKRKLTKRKEKLKCAEIQKEEAPTDRG